MDRGAGRGRRGPGVAPLRPLRPPGGGPPGILHAVQQAGEVFTFGDNTGHATCNLEDFVLGVGAQGQTDDCPELLRAAQRNDSAAVLAAAASAGAAGLETAREGGSTAMHQAASLGHASVIELLLGLRASPGPQSKDGSTPLHKAVEFGHVAAAKALVAGGAQVDARQHVGAAPLMVAAGRGQLAALSFLLEARAQVRGSDPLGAEALHLAAQGGFASVVLRLLSGRADPEAAALKSRWFGGAAVHRALAGGHLETARILLEGGAGRRVARAAGSAAPLFASALAGGRLTGQCAVLEHLVGQRRNLGASDAEVDAILAHLAGASGHPCAALRAASVGEPRGAAAEGAPRPQGAALDMTPEREEI